LCVPDSLQYISFPLNWDDLPKRDDAKKVWLSHARADLADHEMLESRRVFSALGAEVTISEGIPCGSEDLVIDLNMPVKKTACYDIIVDPGTLEHCFNIAQAFDNMDRMLAPRGFVFHTDVVALPNHAFFSISPTAFYDFYQSRGFELGTAYVWIGAKD